jgi:hypothetical protein
MSVVVLEDNQGQKEDISQKEHISFCSILAFKKVNTLQSIFHTEIYKDKSF